MFAPLQSQFPLVKIYASRSLLFYDLGIRRYLRYSRPFLSLSLQLTWFYAISTFIPDENRIGLNSLPCLVSDVVLYGYQIIRSSPLQVMLHKPQAYSSSFSFFRQRQCGHCVCFYSTYPLLSQSYPYQNFLALVQYLLLPPSFKTLL